MTRRSVGTRCGWPAGDAPRRPSPRAGADGRSGRSPHCRYRGSPASSTATSPRGRIPPSNGSGPGQWSWQAVPRSAGEARCPSGSRVWTAPSCAPRQTTSRGATGSHAAPPTTWSSMGRMASGASGSSRGTAVARWGRLSATPSSSTPRRPSWSPPGSGSERAPWASAQRPSPCASHGQPPTTPPAWRRRSSAPTAAGRR